MAKVKETIESIKQRIQNLAQQSIGLPLSFRPAQKVQVPTPAVLGQPVMCDSYRVEVVSPTGYTIDVGHVAFDAETGKVFAVGSVSATVSMLFDKMDQKDRY